MKQNEIKLGKFRITAIVCSFRKLTLNLIDDSEWTILIGIHKLLLMLISTGIFDVAC